MADFDWTNFLGDPAGYASGSNTQGVGGVKKMIFGDPDAIKKAFDQAIGISQQGSKDIKDFLMGQQGKAQQYFAPIQHMFQGMYGTEGLKPQQNTMGPIQGMYGGR